MKENLHRFFDHFVQPVLIEVPEEEMIYLNLAAIKEFDMLPRQMASTDLNKHFSFHQRSKTVNFCSYGKNIYLIDEENISDENGAYKKYSLSKVNHMPDPSLLEHYRGISEKFVHQFRSPLTGISGYVEMLKELETSEKKLNYLDKIQSGLQESFRFLDQTEKFARSVTPEISKFPVKMLVDSAINSICEKDRLRIKQHIPADKNIVSDFTMLSKIVEELVKNALEETAKTENEPVHLEISDDNLIQVRNRINSYSETDFEELFLPFNTKKALHMGLGLPVCQYYCHKLGLSLHKNYKNREREILFQVKDVPMVNGTG